MKHQSHKNKTLNGHKNAFERSDDFPNEACCTVNQRELLCWHDILFLQCDTLKTHASLIYVDTLLINGVTLNMFIVTHKKM